MKLSQLNERVLATYQSCVESHDVSSEDILSSLASLTAVVMDDLNALSVTIDDKLKIKLIRNDIDESIPLFLLEMSKQMHEQDNRITAEPIWQVRCKRFRPTAQGYSDIFHILDTENDYGLVANSSSDIEINQQIVNYLDCDPNDLPVVLESWVDGECDLTHGQEKIDYFLEYFNTDYHELEGFDLLWVEEYEDIVKSAFLTEADANWFIQRKQHDYPKLYTYVVSMYLCPQMIELRNWILSLTKAEVAA